MQETQRITAPIIVVEDDHDDQFFIKSALESLDVTGELIFFDNGKDALDYLQNGRDVFLILCDINMPLMNGLELRRKINADEALRKRSIPFVFISTAARPSEVNAAYDMTVQGFFEKASNFEELKETMRIIIQYWIQCHHPKNL